MYLAEVHTRTKLTPNDSWSTCIASGFGSLRTLKSFKGLHRYVAIDRRDAIQAAFDAILGIIDQVLAVDLVAAERAKSIVLGRTRTTPEITEETYRHFWQVDQG